MERWQFPKVDMGEVRGANDTGVVTFDAEHIKSLVREVLQNSGDAVLDASKPVEADLHMYSMPSGEIPDV